MLIIKRENKVRAAEIVAYAMRKENWYRPGPGVTAPGNRGDHHHANFDGLVSVVFSWTVTDQPLPEAGIKTGDVLRHLSVMTTRSKGLPHPFSTFTIASWFGFTGGETDPGADDVILRPGEDWLVAPHPRERTIVVMQKVPPEELM